MTDSFQQLSGDFLQGKIIAVGEGETVINALGNVELVIVGEQDEIDGVFKALRRFCRENPGWSLFVITPDKDAEKKIMGRRANRRRKLYNGNIETTYYQFHGEK
jgi:23S rRNA G2445 N2-methylase RlmL